MWDENLQIFLALDMFCVGQKFLQRQPTNSYKICREAECHLEI